jgi:hypothetical protein
LGTDSQAFYPGFLIRNLPMAIYSFPRILGGVTPATACAQFESDFIVAWASIPALRTYNPFGRFPEADDE